MSETRWSVNRLAGVVRLAIGCGLAAIAYAVALMFSEPSAQEGVDPIGTDSERHAAEDPLVALEPPPPIRVAEGSPSIRTPSAELGAPTDDPSSAHIDRLERSLQDELRNSGALQEFESLARLVGSAITADNAPAIARILIDSRLRYNQQLRDFMAYQATLTSAEMAHLGPKRELLFDSYWGARCDALGTHLPGIEMRGVIDEMSGGWPLGKRD